MCVKEIDNVEKTDWRMNTEVREKAGQQESERKDRKEIDRKDSGG